MPHTPRDPRHLGPRHRVAEGPLVPLSVRITAEDRDDFMRSYFPDMMQGGMFIRTDATHALELGTRILLRFFLQNGEVVFFGHGLVAWLQRGGGERGIGVQFQRLSPASHSAYREMLRLKRASRPRRPRTTHTHNPSAVATHEFCEIPTKPMNAGARRLLARQTQRERRESRRFKRMTPLRKKPPPPTRRAPASEYMVIRPPDSHESRPALNRLDDLLPPINCERTS